MAKSNSNPGFPTIEQMRKSQADGNEGIGLNEQSYNDDCKDFNHGVSINGEEDTKSPTGRVPSLPRKP
jgi:hypothetical protein